MTLRDGSIWGMALAVSLLLHASLFWQRWTPLTDDDGLARRQAGVTHLSFRSISKPEPPAPVPEEKPQPKPPEPVREPPKPKEKLQKAKAAEPVVVQAEPEVLVQTAAPVVVEKAAGDPQEMERARQQYLGKLLAHIEGHKFYPRVARRRGLQGVIQVSFLLHADGRVTNLQVEDGHQVLQKAAEEAVESALPLPRPPSSVPSPLQVSYGMEFRLN